MMNPPLGCIPPGSEVEMGPEIFFSDFQNPLSWTEEYDPDVMSFAE